MSESKTAPVTGLRRCHPDLIALSLLVLTAGPIVSAQSAATPQDPQASRPPANIGMTHQLVITGCLRRDSSGKYSITNENGKTFNLIAGFESVDLSKHVFHAVKITGKEAPNSTPPEASDNAQSPPPTVLRVLTLEVLSNSCTR